MKSVLVVDVPLTKDGRHLCDCCPIWNEEYHICNYCFMYHAQGCPLRPMPMPDRRAEDNPYWCGWNDALFEMEFEKEKHNDRQAINRDD